MTEARKAAQQTQAQEQLKALLKVMRRDVMLYGQSSIMVDQGSGAVRRLGSGPDRPAAQTDR